MNNAYCSSEYAYDRSDKVKLLEWAKSANHKNLIKYIENNMNRPRTIIRSRRMQQMTGSF